MGAPAALLRRTDGVNGAVPRRQRRVSERWGLPGADRWVVGAAVSAGEDADVELDAVHRCYAEHGLRDGLA